MDLDYSASEFAVEGWMEGLAAEVKPLGIGATLIEPRFFRTDLLNALSLAYGAGGIRDYAEASAEFRTWHDNMVHNQAGDSAGLGVTLVQLSNFPRRRSVLHPAPMSKAWL